jgi:hypothetical protein
MQGRTGRSRGGRWIHGYDIWDMRGCRYVAARWTVDGLERDAVGGVVRCCAVVWGDGDRVVYVRTQDTSVQSCLVLFMPRLETQVRRVRKESLFPWLEQLTSLTT